MTQLHESHQTWPYQMCLRGTKQTSISKMELVCCLPKYGEIRCHHILFAYYKTNSSPTPTLFQMSRMVCPTLVLLAALLALAASQGFYPQRYGKRPDPRQLTGMSLSFTLVHDSEASLFLNITRNKLLQG